MATITEAKTIGDRAVVFGALTGLASLLLPAARWYLVLGTRWFGSGVAAVCNTFSGAVAFGGYLATAPAKAILLGGWLQVSERLADIST
jgi:hypothetical protein